ncbi:MULTISPECIES: GTP-binding protein [unclassified Dysgonomonas]|jgi:G3E family GTPase|uniref:CobW family GTP-binding protein n=1 Tax=unclassified Dysgonomonas TaxID=2630389 RepID=UPI0025BDE277|nr:MULTISPECIES: GTP-binding protein [unclassified Dysgonomonas]MDR2002791.1 GTP-binding protein [Prevotella sp.]HMM03466.1 GTP-binding protein [Dysgonomonas sp.]
MGKIPVTIITGFLGAGKTTLINNLIKEYPEKKFAIIENEFGEIGLDGSFIIGADENIFELSNGCICCSLNNDFYELINKLLTGNYDFNHLLIETTGIADPISIVNAFLSDYEIIERFAIDSVICLVDAVNIEDLINSEPEVRKQLAIADIILLNKVDLVRTGYSDELKDRMQEFNQLARIYPTSKADISQVEILDTCQYLGRKIEQSVSSFKNLTFLGNNNVKHDIKSVGISIPGDLDFERFRFWFETILFFAKYRPYRVKGILSFKDVPEKCILHAIKDNYVFDKGDLWQSNEERYCKLVFIGRNLDNLEIEENIYKLRAE